MRLFVDGICYSLLKITATTVKNNRNDIKEVKSRGQYLKINGSYYKPLHNDCAKLQVSLVYIQNIPLEFLLLDQCRELFFSETKYCIDTVTCTPACPKKHSISWIKLSTTVFSHFALCVVILQEFGNHMTTFITWNLFIFPHCLNDAIKRHAKLMDMKF